MPMRYATLMESGLVEECKHNAENTQKGIELRHGLFSLPHTLSHSVGISFRACLEALAWSTHTEDLQYFLPGTKN